MTITDTLAPLGLSVSTLMLHAKAMAPLSAEEATALEGLQALTLDGWSEADVRANVIDPLVALLGYKKGEAFSVDRERTLDVLGTKLRIDYAATLFEENFWLIEAKRPDGRRTRFRQKELDQALRYAIHPEINAALVVLSDGDLFEVFDREASLAAPVLSFRRHELVEQFDKLRALLEPWQIWFFQKRRVVRLLDKSFDREFNLSRVDEFRDLVNRRLDGKRTVILDNSRALKLVDKDTAQQRQYFNKADPADLIEVHLFQVQNWPVLHMIADRLVEAAKADPFRTFRRLFPDRPRDMNDMFLAQATFVLMTMDKVGITTRWLPDWLRPDHKDHALTPAIETLLERCLTGFAADEPRRLILLYAAAAKRVGKILHLTLPSLEDAARLGHQISRYMGDELSFSQMVASPDGQQIRNIEVSALTATVDFVRRCADERGIFRNEIAKKELRDFWRLEIMLLDSQPNYAAWLAERKLGDMAAVEASCVVWDNLAHTLLAMVHPFDRWKQYLLDHHRQAVDEIVAMGSWAARDLVGMVKDARAERPSMERLAERFFLGDRETADRLVKAYGLRQ